MITLELDMKQILYYIFLKVGKIYEAENNADISCMPSGEIHS